jgi:hypothetical protein
VLSTVLSQSGPSTRLVAITTRKESQPANGGNHSAAVQWLRIDDATFAELVEFPSAPKPND